MKPLPVQSLQATAVLLSITALVELILLDYSPLASITLYLFAVVVSAYNFARSVSLAVAVLSYLLVNYLIVDPRYSLHVPDPRSYFVLAAYLGTSLLVNTLVQKLKDKTEEAERTLARLTEAQERLMQSHEERVKGQLLASLSHDMRTPLTAILGASTSLGTQYDRLQDHERRQLISSIEHEAFHLVSSAENVLALVKLRSLKALPEPRAWQSLSEVVETTVRRYRLRKLPCGIEVHMPNPPLFVKGDGLLLAQALANLLDNALTANLRGDHAAGSPLEPVVIDCVSNTLCSPPCIEWSVSDRGRGFPEHFSTANIQAFDEQARQATATGYGLGLVIVKTIAELHHGTLRIHNRPGGGAKVTLAFEWHEQPDWTSDEP
ncbi:MAG TPA: DUF4118 domain-containing protein [Limnobacter sp.]|uniref:sensor histidine kinase n=1 Tax=Limnobacter sp. TaxID=2003368 RepID=UPI002ED90E17